MLLYKAIGRRNAAFCIQAALVVPSLSLSFHPPPIPPPPPTIPHPKSFIAYPTLPTTCYTIPEDTQRGNLCPGIAAACEIRSRLRKSPCTRNAQCDPAYTRFRLAETLLSMDNRTVSPPILRHILRRRSCVNACRFAIARFVFEMCLASPLG